VWGCPAAKETKNEEVNVVVFYFSKIASSKISILAVCILLMLVTIHFTPLD
jgi:hypothetical protein